MMYADCREPKKYSIPGVAEESHTGEKNDWGFPASANSDRIMGQYLFPKPPVSHFQTRHALKDLLG